MAISSLFGAAASFFYAVSTLLNGAQNNAAIQRTLVQNFESTPSHLIPRVSSSNSYNNYPPSAVGGYSFPATSSSAISNNNNNVYNNNNINVNNTAIYAVQFEPMPPNHAYRPMASAYTLYGSEPAVNISSLPSVDRKTLFPNLSASIRANSGRMMGMPVGNPVGVAYYDGETIATVYADGNGNVSHCELLEVNRPDEQVAALKQLAQENKIIEKIGFHSMLNLIRACQFLDVKNVNPPPAEDSPKGNDFNDNLGGSTPNPLVNPLDVLVGNKQNMWSMISGILPGTKWCGLKDIATNYNDLGTMRDLDKCCRSHDLCPRKVLAFRSAYGLVNWGLYAKSHCECDTALYDCLKRAAIQNPTAELVGNFYFNVLRAQCIDEENPPKCEQFDGFSCVKWENDESDANRLVFREVRRRFR